MDGTTQVRGRVLVAEKRADRVAQEYRGDVKDEAAFPGSIGRRAERTIIRVLTHSRGRWSSLCPSRECSSTII